MQKKYGIGLFLVTCILLAALFFGYSAEEKYLEKLEMEDSRADNLLTTQGSAQRETQYYLCELYGYVVVYLSDRETIYEYTNIPLTELPEALQTEILNGKIIEGTDRLYGFLENYSS